MSAALDEVIDRLTRAKEGLLQLADTSKDLDRKLHLKSKAAGVALALSYALESKRLDEPASEFGECPNGHALDPWTQNLCPVCGWEPVA